MRVVKWNPQQRVDIPDMVATNFLVVGEFRRMVRDLVLGAEENKIIQGFEVEPSGVPDSVVTIRLNNGGGVYSAALGAEDLGTHVTHGQLMGGQDDNQNLEGNAQQALDFSGQPAATYTVQMRFTYADGASDNRAFWNPTTDVEYTQSVSTRHVSGFEVRFSGTASDEWIDLASVVWDAVSIDDADITDLRDFAMEGTTPYQQTTQMGAGGLADFPRGVERGDLGVGVNAIYPVLQALGRQIQDLKGPDDSGNWNWWNYVFSGPDGSNSVLTAGETKSLRSVDTITFSIGDGVTHWGDFNGVTGLEECLQHIEDLAAQCPKNVEILLKAHGVASFNWEVTSAHALPDINLTLRGMGDVAFGGSANVSCTAALAYPNIAISTSAGNIRVENIHMDSVNNVGFFGSTTGFVKVKDSRLDGGYTGTIRSIIFSQVEGLEITGSLISGYVFVEGDSTGVNRKGGLVRDTHFLQGALTFDDGDGLVENVVIENCVFKVTDAAFLGREGCISGDVSFAKISNCKFEYVGDLDGIHLSTNSNMVNVSDCFFAAASVGTHAVDSGQNTTAGTGWGIFISGGQGHKVRSSRFSGADHNDGGGIYANETEGLCVSQCEWVDVGHNSGASRRYECIRLNSSTGFHPAFARIEGCVMRAWFSSATASRGGGITLNNTEHVTIQGCTIDGRAGSPTVGFSGRDAGYAALFIDGSCGDLVVSGNTFIGWETPTTSASRVIVTDTGASAIRSVYSGNNFQACGGAAIDLDGGSPAYVVISGNTFQNVYEGVDITDGDSCVVSNNSIVEGAGAGTRAIDFGTLSSSCIAMGNTSNLAIVGNSNVHGYNETADLNSVGSYA